jgi:hypothetical protein
MVGSVRGTKAGPLRDVPTIPAGIPTGSIEVGPVRSISLVVTPALANPCAIVKPSYMGYTVSRAS